MGNESEDKVKVIYAVKRRIHKWQTIVYLSLKQDRPLLVQHYQRLIEREKNRILKQYQIIID
ncbi:hypothetical protein [Halalkalibacter nanhaiisediminis]|uniref:Uncharacterized protein n=1 Tax=Halalkalibacter nanhaiisediminis TaxID=688079 RepID=A0A562QME8_9BACI|nr:hypothetical protein [Halalkalibacter nanhaiisediminis]TWI57914.1 hypothetical protein IQ10_01243 [Halalkalibacter nanhaiisediminis]